jgi:hypothetical protein
MLLYSFIVVITAFLGLVNTLPAANTKAACTPGKTFNAQLFTVKPDDPSRSSTNTSSPYYVRQDENATNKRLQVIVFSDIPANATKCFIGWFQPLSGTNFGYFTTATMQVYALNLGGKKLADLVDAVSYENIQPLIGETTGQADFTCWPESLNQMDHKTGPVKGGCATEVALLVSKITANCCVSQSFCS